MTHFDDLWEANKDLLTQQGKEEARQLYARIEQLAPKLLMEIGTGAGGSHKLWMDAAPEGAHIILVDLYHVQTMYEAWRAWYKPGQTSVFFANSQLPETFEAVKQHLAGMKLDFLFLDADHHYQNVKREFEWYGSLVKEGGLIGIHDTRHGTWPEFGLSTADWWREFSATHKVEEFFMPEKPCGTGVYYVPLSGT